MENKNKEGRKGKVRVIESGDAGKGREREGRERCGEECCHVESSPKARVCKRVEFAQVSVNVHGSYKSPKRVLQYKLSRASQSEGKGEGRAFRLS